jgi:hypothetical protein
MIVACFAVLGGLGAMARFLLDGAISSRPSASAAGLPSSTSSPPRPDW